MHSGLVTIHQSMVGGEAISIPLTTSLVIADGTENEHRAVLKLIRTYLHDFEEFGRVAFEMRPFETAGGVQSRDVALLNQEQATLLLAYMRNTDVVRKFKKALVKAFWVLARVAQVVPSFAIPKTLTEALRLAADLEEQRATLAAKLVVVDGARRGARYRLGGRAA